MSTILRRARNDALNPPEVERLLSGCRDLLDNIVVLLPVSTGMLPIPYLIELNKDDRQITTPETQSVGTISSGIFECSVPHSRDESTPARAMPTLLEEGIQA